MYVPDNLDAYRWHETQQARLLEHLPECAYCGEPIQATHLYLINGDTYCPECLENEFRKEVEDYTE